MRLFSSTSFQVPPQLQDCSDGFEKFYSKKHNGRKVGGAPSYPVLRSHCSTDDLVAPVEQRWSKGDAEANGQDVHLSVQVKSSKRTILVLNLTHVVSTYQIGILLLFNNVPVLPYEELKSLTLLSTAPSVSLCFTRFLRKCLFVAAQMTMYWIKPSVR